MPILSRVAARIFLAAGLFTCILSPRLLSQSKAATIDDLARQSEVVAVGKVRDLSSEWDETGTRIRTKVLLHVDQFVKGSASENTLTLYVPGGEVGSVGEVYSHMPVFHRDEQVIVFAEKDKQQRYRVSAGQQGKFTVEKDQLTGKALVPGHATLEAFTREIQTTVQRQRSGDLPGH